MTLRVLHRSSAVFIAAFALVHLLNHLLAWGGAEVHVGFMQWARGVYRSPWVESLLMVCISFQVLSGLWHLLAGWRLRQGRVAWIQAFTGAYLAFFLLAHVAAVWWGRVVLEQDTNFYFLAASMNATPAQWVGFALYYFLAVFSLFVHLGCALYWQVHERDHRAAALALALPAGLGAAVSVLIVLAIGARA